MTRTVDRGRLASRAWWRSAAVILVIPACTTPRSGWLRLQRRPGQLELGAPSPGSRETARIRQVAGRPLLSRAAFLDAGGAADGSGAYEPRGTAQLGPNWAESIAAARANGSGNPFSMMNHIFLAIRYSRIPK